MIKEAIVKIVNKEDLTYDEAYTVMNEIMSGGATATQNAAFLAALSTKSARAETTDEIAGCAAAMRAHATKVETGMEVFEIVGTGGDNAGRFNISTTSALVAAAGGMKVAKHGNRAASSQCGTADCLEALGVNIQQSPARCVETKCRWPCAQVRESSASITGTSRTSQWIPQTAADCGKRFRPRCCLYRKAGFGTRTMWRRCTVWARMRS